MDAVVLHPVTISGFFEHAIENGIRPVHIIVCAEPNVFMHQILSSIKNQDPRNDAENGETFRLGDAPLLAKSLDLLSAVRDIRIAFCDSSNMLQAYLATLPKHGGAETLGESASSTEGGPWLALVNPVALHEDGSSFSAQGLSKTFAFAVEAALRGHQKLVVVECIDQKLPAEQTPSGMGEENDGNNEDEQMHLGEGRIGGRHVADEDERSDAIDPWEQRIPILNSTTKTFGGAPERAWLGRTVRIADVIGRWCNFERL